MKYLQVLLIQIILIGFIASCGNKTTNTDSIPEAPKETEFSNEVKLKRLTDALLANPANADLYYQRAVLYLDLNKGKEAYDDALQAISIDSLQGKYYLVKAKALYTIPNLRLAIIAAENAERLGFNEVDLYSILTELHFVKKDYKKANEYIVKALKISKYESKPYFYRAMMLAEKGDTTKAINELQYAIEYNPEFVDAYNQMAVYQFSKKQYDLAKNYLLSGLRFAPKDGFLNYNMAWYYRYTNQADSAESYFGKAVFFNPDMYLAQYEIGLLSFEKRAYATALSNFNAALKVNPNEPAIVNKAMLCNEYIGENDEAIRLANHLLSLNSSFSKSAKECKERVQNRLARLNAGRDTNQALMPAPNSPFKN